MKIKNGDKIAFPNGTLLTFINMDVSGKKKRTLQKWAKEYSETNMLPAGYRVEFRLETYLIESK